MRFLKWLYCLAVAAIVGVLMFFVAATAGVPSSIALADEPRDSVSLTEVVAATHAAAAINSGIEASYHTTLIQTLNVGSDDHTLVVHLSKSVWQKLSPTQQDGVRKGLLSSFSGSYWQAHANTSSSAPPPRLVLQLDG